MSRCLPFGNSFIQLFENNYRKTLKLIYGKSTPQRSKYCIPHIDKSHRETSESLAINTKHCFSSTLYLYTTTHTVPTISKFTLAPTSQAEML